MTLRIMDDVDPTATLHDYAMNGMAEQITRAREAGQFVLYDIDDDIWHIPEWSPAATAMNARAPHVRAYDLDVIDANIRASGHVLVSTPRLYDVVCNQFRESIRFHGLSAVRCHLARPGINPSVYPKRLWERRPLRVGWMGSMSHHLPHLRTIMDALDVVAEHGAEFVHIGHIDGDESWRALGDLPCRWSQLSGGGDSSRWGHIQEVPAMLAQVDIGLIPRMPDAFHLGQSVTSGLQYACAGVPFLVSPSPEYERLERLGAGKVCRTVNDWRQGLADLLEFTDYRRSEAELARECVAVEFGLEATGRRYRELLEGITRGQ